MLTVALNATVFDVCKNTAYIKAELQTADATVSAAQAENVAHGL